MTRDVPARSWVLWGAAWSSGRRGPWRRAPPSGSSRPRSPRPQRWCFARRARSAPAPRSPRPGPLPLQPPPPPRRHGGRPRPPCGLSSGCCSCCYSAEPRARSVPQRPQVGRAARAGADPPAGPECCPQDAVDRGQGPWFLCVRVEGAHLLLLSEGLGGTQPGVPRIVTGTHDHSREAFAFLFRALLCCLLQLL